MILFINTSTTDLIEVKLISEGKIINHIEHHEPYKQSELLLKLIDKIVKSVESIKSVAVVSGPGAFSALRLGVATANSLAWAWKIPIIELSVDEVGSDEELIKTLEFKYLEPMTNDNQFKSVVPKYGKEPNITG